jgi:hypothetical protein
MSLEIGTVVHMRKETEKSEWQVSEYVKEPKSSYD